ncbi:MAG: cardiolipin synthase [Lachnospiraceae bacterium]|nr:cardiolipin synthase [Lachnospiraceae bacterium]
MSKLSARLRLTLLALILQIVIAGVIAVFIINRFPPVAYVGIVTTILALFFILKKDEASAYKILWIIVMLAFPPLGGVAYLLFGNMRHTKKIRVHANEHALIAKLLDGDGNLPFINQIACGRMYSLMRYIRKTSSYHAYRNTQTKYYTLGESKFEDMIYALEQAKHYIFLEYFIIYKSEMWERLLEVLLRKVNEGIEVRLIIDDFGSQRLFTNVYIEKLEAQGIKTLRFNPMIPFFLLFMNNRDHRKILVIDGHTAFCGGLNISDEYINKNSPFGIWKDTGLRLTGEGVWSFTLMFIEMWDTFCETKERINDYTLYKSKSLHVENSKTDGFVLPFGDTPLDEEQLSENIYVDILHQAKDYIYIFTPYLIISEKMIHALQMTAKRGVDVRLILPGIPDKKIIFQLTRSYYTYLYKAGVKIYEYTPGFLHAKSLVCDDEIAIVGTINLDYRSLYLHFECGTLLYQSSVIKDIKEDALQTIAGSQEVQQDERKSSGWGELLDAILHLFSPLL